MSNSHGYVVLVRLKKEAGIRQGAWAFCRAPSQDEMNWCHPDPLPDLYTAEHVKKGELPIPDDMVLFEEKADAVERAELLVARHYVYSYTGDYEILKVKRKEVKVYRGFEAVS